MIVEQEQWHLVSRDGEVTPTNGSVGGRVDKGKAVNRVRNNTTAGTQVQGCNWRIPVSQWKEEEGECSYRSRRRGNSDDGFGDESDVTDRDSDDSFEGAVVVSLKERWA